MTWLKSFSRIYFPFVLFGIFVLFLAGLYPIVRFPEEQIDIEVYPDFIWVKGTYTYKNPLPFPVAQGFTIPLPVDTIHPEPVQLTANVLTPHEKPIHLKGARLPGRCTCGYEGRKKSYWRSV